MKSIMAMMMMMIMIVKISQNLQIFAPKIQNSKTVDKIAIGFDGLRNF